MKKIIIVVLLTCFLAIAGFTQNFNNPQFMEKLGLTQQQVEQLESIYEEAQMNTCISNAFCHYTIH